MPLHEAWFDDPDDEVQDGTEEEYVWVDTGPGQSKLVKVNSYTRTSVPVTDGKVLSDAERRSIETLTGVEGVETWQEAKAAVAITGNRFIEKGEAQDRYRQDRKHWMASGKNPEERGPMTWLPQTLYPEREREARRPGKMREIFIKEYQKRGKPVPRGLWGHK